MAKNADDQSGRIITTLEQLQRGLQVGDLVAQDMLGGWRLDAAARSIALHHSAARDPRRIVETS